MISQILVNVEYSMEMWLYLRFSNLKKTNKQFKIILFGVLWDIFDMTENGRFLLFKPVYKGLLSPMFEVSVTKSQRPYWRWNFGKKWKQNGGCPGHVTHSVMTFFAFFLAMSRPCDVVKDS